MASVVMYFQVHQPFRLRRYTVFDTDHFYFDNAKNEEIMRKVAHKCYRPATRLLLDLIKRHQGRFRISYAITGVALEQMEMWAPDIIAMFQEMAETGCVEFLSETHDHSLSFLYSRDEFVEQTRLHADTIERLFGQRPTVFRNTELIYTDDLAHFMAAIKDADGKPLYKGMLCEGVDALLSGRSPNYVYRPPHTGPGAHGGPFALLLKNYRLSDDIAFRFSNRGWSEWPLSAEKFAQWVNQINGDGYLCNLFMDYETFGEHQWEETGIFKFLEALPEKIFDINPGHNHFNTPSQAIEQFPPVGEYHAPHMTSWADTERDLSAWIGNAMQANALQELYKLEKPVKRRLAAAQRRGDAHEVTEATHLLDDWRKLTTSDHFYYMCTKYFADGDVHKYFNPYDSPYDSYINFMNVLDNVRARITAATESPDLAGAH